MVFVDPGSVPENWREENLEAGSSTSMDCVATGDGLDRRPGVGYCNQCQNGKPPRCHHCSVCKPKIFFSILLHATCFIYLFN